MPGRCQLLTFKIVRSVEETTAHDHNGVMHSQEDTHASLGIANQQAGGNRYIAMKRWYKETAQERYWNTAAHFPETVRE